MPEQRDIPEDRTLHLSEKVCRLLDAIQTEIRNAMQMRDEGRVKELAKAIHTLTVIAVTKEAFQECDGKIKGPNGVASHLGMTRYGVYARIECLKLEIDDFRSETEATDLLRKSVGESSPVAPVIDTLSQLKHCAKHYLPHRIQT